MTTQTGGPRAGLPQAMGPLLLALGSALVKVSVFNLPQTHSGADWFPWRPGQAIEAVASSLAVLLLLFAPLALLRARRRYLGAWGLNAVLSLLVLADLLSLRYYSDVLPMASLSIAWQAVLIWRSILALLRPTDALLLADLMLAGMYYWVWYRRLAREPAVVRPWGRAGGMVALGLVGLLVPMRVIRRDSDEVFVAGYFRFYEVREIGLPALRGYELVRLLRARMATSGDNASQVAGIRRRLDSWAPRDSTAGPLFGAARRANVILILVESLHAFPLRLVVDGQPVMPNLRAFAERSMSFENFYGQAWLGKTANAEFVALNSLLPLSDELVQVRYPENQFRALPQILAEHGYDTFSAHAYYGALYKMREMHPRFGIKRSYFIESYQVTDWVGMGMADADFFRQTVPRLAGAPRPFMAYLLTLATHYPFTIPERHKTLRLGELEDTWVGRYLQTVHYFDSAFGELWRDLERAGLMKQSVVAIFGDHRENSLESGVLAHLLNRYSGFTPRTTGLDLQLWREENRLPFIVHLPEDRGAGQRFASGAGVDIAPTLLGLLGIEKHGMISLGRDLDRNDPGLVVLRDASFILGDTVCVAPGTYTSERSCGLLSTGAAIDPARFARELAEARERLAVSDLIVRGNLVRKLTELRAPAPARLDGHP